MPRGKKRAKRGNVNQQAFTIHTRSSESASNETQSTTAKTLPEVEMNLNVPLINRSNSQQERLMSYVGKSIL